MAFFRAKKVPKSQDVEKTPFTLYNPNPTKMIVPPTQPPVQIVSIDPASKNYAFRIERRWAKNKVETVVFERNDFTPQIDEKTNQNNIYQILTEYLDKYKEFYKGINIVIIERQPPINYITVRLSQHTLSYFLDKLKGSLVNPVIVEISSKLKKDQLGGPTHLTDRAVKKWFVSKARSFFDYCKDQNGLTIMEKNRKADDLADTRCQIEAFLSYTGWMTGLSYEEIIDLPLDEDWKITSKPKKKKVQPSQPIQTNQPKEIIQLQPKEIIQPKEPTGIEIVNF